MTDNECRQGRKVERFGAEWWALYAAAWQSRWTAEQRQSVLDVRRSSPTAVVLMCQQDADQGIAAFNEAMERA